MYSVEVGPFSITTVCFGTGGSTAGESNEFNTNEISEISSFPLNHHRLIFLIDHRPSSLPSFDFFHSLRTSHDTRSSSLGSSQNIGSPPSYFFASKQHDRHSFQVRPQHNIHQSVPAPKFLSSSVIPWNQVIWFQDFITCKNFAQRILSLLSCAFRLVFERFAPCVIALSAVSFYLHNYLIHDGQAYRRKSDRSNDSR